MLYLASASPRRAELLRQIGVEFGILPVSIDESPRPGESPEALVLRLAREKARAGWQTLQAPGPDDAVLGADTMIHLDGAVIGKPRDRADCAAILGRLSGRQHEVLSAVALKAGKREPDALLNRNWVFFRPLEGAEIRAYCASAEPRDKAGAYAIQGRAAVFIERLEGSYSGVMGLPLFETAALLCRHGIEVRT